MTELNFKDDMGARLEVRWNRFWNHAELEANDEYGDNTVVDLTPDDLRRLRDWINERLGGS